MDAEITPAPTAEEAAAVVAAVEALWPRPVILDDSLAGERRVPTWRFSGRWWARPIAARRDRPYR
jgi:hypothetical protein